MDRSEAVRTSSLREALLRRQLARMEAGKARGGGHLFEEHCLEAESDLAALLDKMNLFIRAAAKAAREECVCYGDTCIGWCARSKARKALEDWADGSF